MITRQRPSKRTHARTTRTRGRVTHTQPSGQPARHSLSPHDPCQLAAVHRNFAPPSTVLPCVVWRMVDVCRIVPRCCNHPSQEPAASSVAAVCADARHASAPPQHTAQHASPQSCITVDHCDHAHTVRRSAAARSRSDSGAPAARPPRTCRMHTPRPTHTSIRAHPSTPPSLRTTVARRCATEEHAVSSSCI